MNPLDRLLLVLLLSLVGGIAPSLAETGPPEPGSLATAEVPVAATSLAAPDVAARPPNTVQGEDPVEVAADVALTVQGEDPVEVAADAALTAREIYQRVLENRFDSSVQELAIISSDRAGNVQNIRMQQLWKRYPEGSESDRKGIISRTVVRYLEPADYRKTGYLVINKRDQPNDQFIYLASMRRVRRINLRNETIAGTDLSIEDLVPRELDDAEYVRVPDDEVDGQSCFVVEASPKPEMESAYTRFWLYIEKEHYVPIRVRYWDRKNVEVKELRSPHASIREIEGIWLPLEARMRHLLEETETRMVIDVLVPNPELPDRYFSQRQLQAMRLRLPADVMERAQKL